MSQHNSSLVSGTRTLRAVCLAILVLTLFASTASALSSPNIPLDSPVYSYLEKLAGFGLVRSDVAGIKPFSRAEAARLLLEAEWNMEAGSGSGDLAFARTILAELRRKIPREAALYREPDTAPAVDVNPMSSARVRYVYLDGKPRSYERPVHDPGDDGVFGIGSGLRPANPYPSPVQQHGTEGTSLMENNEGIVYRDGHNVEVRFSAEASLGSVASALVEPQLSYSREGDGATVKLVKGYLKIGGGGAELEVGRDANWLGLGSRGAVTLTNNARNFDLVKLSSPEPILLKYVGALKYAFIGSRFDTTVTDGEERRPWFLGAKLSVKPVENFEIGINYGKQFAGPGVDNSFGDFVRGIFGGMSSDNTNNLAGVEMRLRLPKLRNTELYGEFSGEDSASFWPIVESYVAGVYIPRLTASGRDDLRFEFFKGNNILYTNSTFPGGYLYKGMPIGHSQGGAVIEFYLRYSHWFSVRNNLALEFFRTDRGHEGRVTVDAAGRFDPNGVMQAIEKKHAGRVSWSLPVHGDLDMNLLYGIEKVENVDLVAGEDRTNQLFKAEVRYRY
ncbi:capsule assembly Wzi family protein [Geobacter sp.]|uniref:capsule assembly Wzi family protein n=1 Tax=Geobacter sp. TaxID=46610 RepID=UPI0027BAB2C8|nr:capsule assembly Wzi family protein [Geobacter sp.]